MFDMFRRDKRERSPRRRNKLLAFLGIGLFDTRLGSVFTLSNNWNGKINCLHKYLNNQELNH